MSKFKNALSQGEAHRTTLFGSLLFSWVVCLVFIALYIDAKEEQLFRIPPDLRQGTVMRANDIAPPVIYGYAFYILQQLNHWPDDGEKNFPEKIYYLQAYLTPGFRETLLSEMEKKSRNGELKSRVRNIQEVWGRGYTEDRVQIESEDSWIVWVDVEISETIHGRPVKNVYVQYPMRIVRYDVDPESNPWGLAISGYEGEPFKLTDRDIVEPFKRVM